MHRSGALSFFARGEIDARTRSLASVDSCTLTAYYAELYSIIVYIYCGFSDRKTRNVAAQRAESTASYIQLRPLIKVSIIYFFSFNFIRLALEFFFFFN